ncbi:MAG TPA: peptide chain release factor N(5)-glutamine methyltransferase [Gammaproteobacteria bacterium]
MNAAKSTHTLAPLARCERTDELLAAATGAIEAAGTSESPRLDAMLLLWQATERPRASFFASPERLIPRAERLEFAELVARRVRGEPVAYIVGSQEFFSLPLHVGPGVLVPRPETELLVEAALARCSSLDGPAVLDVGTGSGAIALAIKHSRRDVRMTGVDVSAEALEQARVNEGLVIGGREVAVRWIQSRWFEALAGERFDLIVSNPPYVRSAEIVGPLKFEPQLALDGGTDGLAAYRVLFAEAPKHLNAGGVLLVEHGWDQRPELVALAEGHGWRVAAARDDLAGRPRVLELERSAP